MLVPMPWHTFQSPVFPQAHPQPCPSTVPMAVLLCEGHWPVVNKWGMCVQKELFPRLPRQRSRAVEMPLGHWRRSAVMSPLLLVACVRVLHTQTSNWENTLQSGCCEFPAQLRHFPHQQDIFRAGRNPSFKRHSSLPPMWTLHSSPASAASFPFPLVPGAVGRGISPFLESYEVQVLRKTIFPCGC